MSDNEKALLGALLSGYQEVSDIAAVIAPHHFESPLHADIYRAILKVCEAGQRVDAIITQHHLSGTYPLPDNLYLFNLSAGPFLGANAPYYAQQVIAESRRRSLWATGVRLTQAAEDQRQDPDDICATAIKALTTDDEQDRSMTPMQGVVDDAALSSIAGNGRGISSPWPDLDDLTRGFFPGRLYVVGARPGVGKSLLASNLAVHVARQGIGVFVASLEMARQEFGQRCLAAEAKVNYSAIEGGTMTSSELDKFSAAMESLGSIPVDVADAESQTLAYIRSCARRAARRRRLGVVIIDYLQLVEPTDRRLPRHEQVAELSRGLKRLARELDTSVVALAQVNRAPTQRKDGRPTLADLRESGAIEADADSVLLLHSPEEDPSDITAILAKGRSSAKGDVKLMLQGHFSRIVSVARRP